MGFSLGIESEFIRLVVRWARADDSIFHFFTQNLRLRVISDFELPHYHVTSTTLHTMELFCDHRFLSRNAWS